MVQVRVLVEVTQQVDRMGRSGSHFHNVLSRRHRIRTWERSEQISMHRIDFVGTTKKTYIEQQLPRGQSPQIVFP